ncbi:MAG: hypothetical protein ACLFWD_02780 [Anaerolineales bacterium]
MPSEDSFTEIIEKNLWSDPDWAPYARGEAPLPDRPFSGRLVAKYLFYLGKDNKAREVCEMVARSTEKKFSRREPSVGAYSRGFDAALYYDLARNEARARSIWSRIADGVEDLEPEQIFKQKKANVWVYQAYALTKLGEHEQVKEPAQRGRNAIENGKGTHKAPHRNSREFALGPLLVKLADYKIHNESAIRQEAQQALIEYKQENVLYGRLGYLVIFDLQFSYPDVFDPVLPGEDPEKD